MGKNGMGIYQGSSSSQALGTVKGTRNHFLGRLRASLMDRLFTRENVLLAAAFLLGRALLFGELAPFGVALWAVMYREKRESCPKGALFLLLGAFTTRGFMGMASLPAAMILMAGLEKILETRRISVPLPLLAALGVTAGRLPFLAVNSFIPYDYFLFLLEVILVIPVTAFLHYGASLIWSLPKQQDSLKQEEVLGGLFLFAFLLLGLAEGPAWAALVQEMVIKGAVMILAFLYGGALGASTGLILGTFLGIGTADYAYVPVLAFGGLLAGIFREMGKVGTVAGFLLGLLLCSFYLGGNRELINHLPQAGAVSLLFLALPSSLFHRIESFSPAFSLLTGNGRVDEDIRRLTSRRLKDLSRVFQRIGGAFRDAADGGVQAHLAGKLETEACRDCPVHKACRQKGFQEMGAVLQKNLDNSKNRTITIRDLPLSFRKKCRHVSRYLKDLNELLEGYRVEAAGRSRLEEGRALVVSQMEGLATIINEFSNEIKLKIDNGGSEENAGQQAFTMEMGVSQIPRDGQEVSGDYYSLLSLRTGKQGIILSDGMGSGPRAREESKGTVNLLEELLEADFPQDLVLRTVNTVMRLRSEEEAFATLDMALMDFQDGGMEICKICASPSFIKRGNQVKELSASSLPLGILADIQMDVKRERLQDGDLLVMTTDGVSEAGIKLNGSPNWIGKILLELDHRHPQLVADRVLQEALNRNRGQSLDDMSIIVCRVVRLGNH